jgi:uncharacterized protein YraI
MRRVGVGGVGVVLVCLLLSACGGGGGASTSSVESSTSSITSSTEATTTTTGATTTLPPTTSSTTYAWPTVPVEAVDHCVVDQAAGDALNVRSGPSTSYPVIGTLAFDATAVSTTGVGAQDEMSRMWWEVEYGGGTGWVASWLLTQSPCQVTTAADFCVIDTVCTDRLNVRSGPAASYPILGSLPFDAVGVQATGASATDPNGRTWLQVRFRGGVGWAASWFLDQAPCSASSGDPCTPPSGGPTATCVSGWTTPHPGSTQWLDALADIGVGTAGWSEMNLADFVVEEMRYCTGPEDVDIFAPRPTVERYYIVGYSETDPTYRGRWLLRKGLFDLGLAAVASYDSVGFGSGVWQTCPDPCQTGRPLFDEWCDPGCVEDYTFHPCEGIAPGTWVPGDCFGPPPEVLGCFG